MRRALVLAAAVLALAVAAFLVAVPIALQRSLTAEGVARRASDLFGRHVTVEEVHLAFRPALRIRAEGLEIEGGGWAEAVEVELAILPLLLRRIEPAELHLRRPTIFVHRAADGSLRAGLLQLPKGSADGSTARIPPIDAHDGELVLLEADGTPADAPRLEVRLLEQGELAHGRPTHTRLRIGLLPSSRHRWSLGEARLEGFVNLTEEGTRIESGRIEGHELVVRGLKLDAFDGSFGYAAGGVDVEQLSFSGYEGKGRASGRLRIGRPTSFGGTIALDGMDASAMAEDWHGAPLASALGLLEARGEVALAIGALERATGSGELELRDGRLPTRSVFSALLGSLGRLAGKLIPFSAGGQEASGAHSRLERLGASWELRDSRFHSSNVDLVTDDYTYRAAGSLGLDQSLAFKGHLQLTSRGVQRLMASAALPLPKATSAIPQIPVTVSGSLGAPSVTANATALPSSATSALTGLVKGTARTGTGVLKKVIGR